MEKHYQLSRYYVRLHGVTLVNVLIAARQIKVAFFASI